MLAVFLAQNVLAILLILVVVFCKSSTAVEAGLTIVSAWLLMIGIAMAGLWYYPPPIGKWTYLLLLGCASLYHFLRMKNGVSARGRTFKRVVTLAFASLGSVLVWQVVSGRVPVPGEFVDLDAPLARASGNCVISGGTSLVHNFHYLLRRDPETRYEMHSLDFTKRSKFGFRTKTGHVLEPQPRDPSAYLIFDTGVFAPCSGRVIKVVSNKPDHLSGDQFRDRSGVNQVVLQCGDAHVALVHFRQNSILVEEGQEVSSGEMLGRVGNSGNSEEPHLHINGQTPPDAGGLKNPIPLRFNGQFLGKNDCL